MNTIAKNTLMLYFRQIIILLVGLYTVRVVLNVLGADNYGLYHVITGVVTMCTFLSGSMAMASQRFLSFELGGGDFDKLKKTFAVSWIIYGFIALAALLLLETIGLWFVQTKLVLPPERVYAANWAYQFAIVSFLCMIMTTPYISAIIAHEDMGVFAFISLLEVLLKLGVVFLLQYLSTDKLPTYAILLSVVSFVCLLAYVFVCKTRYKECRFFLYWDWEMFREIAGFTGWSLFGQLTTVFRYQAVTVLLNQMFNPAVVAARAIAMQILGAVNSFSANFNTGLYPPIVKSYAAGQTWQTIKYVFVGSRITYFLMLLFSLPLILEMRTVLSLWLKNPPEYAVLFAQLALIDGLVNSVSLPLMTAARATGKVAFYELTLGSMQVACFFVSLLVLLLGAPPESVMYVSIGISILMFDVRLRIVRSLLDFSLRAFCREVALPAAVVTVLAVTASVLICHSLPENLPSFFLKLVACILVTGGCIYCIGITGGERGRLSGMIERKILGMGTKNQ